MFRLTSSNRASTGLVAVLLCWAVGGCGSGSEGEKPSQPETNVPPTAPAEKAGRDDTEQQSIVRRPKTVVKEQKSDAQEQRPRFDEPPRNLGDLVKGNEANKPFLPQRLPVDDDRLMLHGIRKLVGNHLTLYTDLPPSPDVEELPKVFDLAVPQWCEYFQIDEEKVADWQMTVFIMKDKSKFQTAEVFPDHLPPFEFGYQLGWEIWLYEQLTDAGAPAVYYRRHLLLHEGTHGFMNFFLRGTGPLWYAEGMAELLATHWWDGESLTLNYMPEGKEELPYWGRVKLIQDDFAAQRGKNLSDIFALRPTGQLSTDIYAWCWAAATFFDNHPHYQDRFKALQEEAGDRTTTFTNEFYEQIKPDEQRIVEEWLLFVMELDYGYDVARAAVEHKPGEPLPAGGPSVDIAADRGWQSTGILLQAGTTYQITASGRYQVGDKPKPWWCEPNGVTIDYYRGRPLGMLTGAIRNDDNPLANGISPLATPVPIGLQLQTTPTNTGTLYVRINESPAHLDDNAGTLTVSIVRE